MSLVRWPEDMRPEVAPVRSYNELAMDVPPDLVWGWLIRASLWPTFYENCKDVRFLNGTPPDLAPGTLFTWTTFGVRVTTKVEEFRPNERLAWSGRGLGARGYHGWVIDPTPGGCRVVTEETQRGAVPSLGRIVFRALLARHHQRWLEGLLRVARTGKPP